MSAYIIFIREKTLDKSELEQYWAKIGATFAGHPITVLTANSKPVVLMGPEVEAAVIAEFPGIADAEKWYRSDAYQAAAVHSYNGAVYTGIIVEGIPSKSNN